MKIKVEVKNEILGNSVFWEGDAGDIDQLKTRNIVAHRLAQIVAKDPDVTLITDGMWIASEIA